MQKKDNLGMKYGQRDREWKQQMVFEDVNITKV